MSADPGVDVNIRHDSTAVTAQDPDGIAQVTVIVSRHAQPWLVTVAARAAKNEAMRRITEEAR